MMQTPEGLAETPFFKTDAFSEVLNIVHVHGESARLITADRPVTDTIPAGTPCVYILEQGQLDIRPTDRPAVTLRRKQIALMLQGTAHEAVFSAAPQPSAQRGSPSAIQCFCGQFTVDGDLAERVLKSLPQVIVLDGLDENPIEWLDEMCGLVLRELGTTRPGASLMVSRLLDLLLVVILRRWATSHDSLPGWVASASDERIARAVAAIHSDPARKLSNGELAAIAGMSVSSFAERFKQLMGSGPSAYLRAWRLDQAAEALLHSSAPIDAIADRVGYASKEAFSRAFQARFGQPPSVWRDARPANVA